MVIDLAKPEDAVIATTGKAGRELFELRNSRNQPNDDFLTVGGMGHASTIALGVAQFQRQRCVICLDGDGAVLMHMGSLATIGAQKPQNLVHVLLNNGSHDRLVVNRQWQQKLILKLYRWLVGITTTLLHGKKPNLKKPGLIL